MRILVLVLAGFGVFSAFSPVAVAEPTTTTLKFSVMRNGDQIGTSTITLQRNGSDTVAHVASHVEVKIAFITVYRFDQTETEHWSDGKLVAMTAVTDDNGTPHKVTATRHGDALAVDADGKTSRIDGRIMPASLWNASLVQKTMALNLQDGSLTPVSVVDHGQERLVLQGRPTTAHHYSIKTSFPQDVWYDEHQHLVKLELRGSDGSKIHYQPG